MSISSCGRPAAVFIAMRSSRPANRNGARVRHVDLDAAFEQLLVASYSRHVPHHVEPAEAGAQDPVAAQGQALLVRLDPKLGGVEVIRSEWFGRERRERASEPAEVVAIGRGHDVDVLRRAHDAVRAQGERADDHERAPWPASSRSSGST